MSKYNTPADFDLLNQIKALQDRISVLERQSRPSSVAPVYGTPASEWATAPLGSYPQLVTSATFVDTFYFHFPHAAPTPIVTMQCNCGDGTTSGEWRLASTSTLSLTGPGGVTVPPMVIPLGTVADTVFANNQSPNYWDDFPIGTPRLVRLQVRRTAGAGTITVRARHLVQVAS